MQAPKRRKGAANKENADGFADLKSPRGKQQDKQQQLARQLKRKQRAEAREVAEAEARLRREAEAEVRQEAKAHRSAEAEVREVAEVEARRAARSASPPRGTAASTSDSSEALPPHAAQGLPDRRQAPSRSGVAHEHAAVSLRNSGAQPEGSCYMPQGAGALDFSPQPMPLSSMPTHITGSAQQPYIQHPASRLTGGRPSAVQPAPLGRMAIQVPHRMLTPLAARVTAPFRAQPYMPSAPAAAPPQWGQGRYVPPVGNQSAAAELMVVVNSSKHVMLSALRTVMAAFKLDQGQKTALIHQDDCKFCRMHSATEAML